MRAVGARRDGDPALVAPWFFPTVEEYGRLLSEGGFTVREIELVPRPTLLKTGIEGWLRTFGRSFFDQFPEPERTQRRGRGRRAAAAFAVRQPRAPGPRTIFGFVSPLNAALDESRHTNAQFMAEAFAGQGAHRSESREARSQGVRHDRTKHATRLRPGRRDGPFCRRLHAGVRVRGGSCFCGNPQEPDRGVRRARQGDGPHLASRNSHEQDGRVRRAESDAAGLRHATSDRGARIPPPSSRSTR